MNKLYNYLQKRLLIGKLTSSWIISGDNLILTLKELLDFINKELLKTPIAIEHNSDVLIIKRLAGSRDITIEQIRNLQQFFYSTAGLSKHKIAIIVEADLMNIYANNACLKVLEEAKADNYIFLLTKNPLSLPQTIRSRCLYFNIPINMEDIFHNELYLKFIDSVLNKKWDIFVAEFKNKNRELWLQLTDFSLYLMIRLIKNNLTTEITLLALEQKLFNLMQNKNTDSLYKKLSIVYRLTQNTIKYDLELMTNYIILIEELSN